MTKKKPRKTRKVHRDAVTGRFVTESHVKKHPRTTVTETVEIKRPKKKPKRSK